ncbi:L-rhamnose mutarotase [Streptomyces radicis]|uniref:L-rhamnose mutarotase n=1 Tax=Streptomyces radicis TaxID=1750517 RepID=A0A3A9WI38_9ACTN|nr:L-rhamnose mutarotase [Streptomyces radicis]RKN12500.1 L-rhamnose mutarotase [Streptomyces radicis]RKN27732.1 L-rhamnose mutarotase [Streptomyces radicis]
MTQRVAVHTRLKPGREADYDRVHATIPAELAERLRAAGVVEWRIWRSGRDLFHEIEVADYRAMRRALADDPVNVAWQARMAELLEVEDDYAGDNDGLPLVWSLA